ncbi:hypothetical protein Taro_015486 [Colocasia esculenta]|uniref:Uncharacterized protein n=1 Tax=Colocasia esculenta TaxID=4460 RepID=A0A843UKY6_COLES|nr:hypothetical protein [Colocasia esculenta]
MEVLRPVPKQSLGILLTKGTVPLKDNTTPSMQEGEMEQYLKEKKASQKRPTATFQRQDKKKTVYQTPQKPVAVNNSQGAQRGAPAPAVAAAAPATGRPGRPRAPARVFALAREDAEQAEQITEGTPLGGLRGLQP